MAYGDQFAPNNYANAWLAKKQAQKHADEQQRQEAAVRIDYQLETLLPHVEAVNIAAMRKTVGLLAKKHRFTVEVRTTMPSGASAYADSRRRNIVVPPITDEDTFAVCLHEAGHILAGECPRREPHRPDPTVTRWHHCLECEVSAWQHAMQLIPFSRAMHERLAESLQSYRRSTPGSAAAVERLDRLAGSVSWAEDVSRRRREREREAFAAHWRKKEEQLERQARAKRRNG
jgi:hypothetical protein